MLARAQQAMTLRRFFVALLEVRRTALRVSALTLRRVFLLLFVVNEFRIGVLYTVDPDMWWHLRTGDLIWRQGIPRQDPFSFTLAGHDWVAHEWLSDALMWAIYCLGGLPGLCLVFAAIIALAFWLVYVCCDGRPYLAAAVTLLATAAAGVTFGVRPQMFNILFAAAFVNILERVRLGQAGPRWLGILPPLTALWANLHSGFLLGIALLAAYAIGDAIEALLHTPTDRRNRSLSASRLVLLAVACLAASLLNAHGYRLWTYPFGTLGSAVMQGSIQEWQSPDFHLYPYWPFLGMMGLGVAACLSGKTRPSAIEVVLFLGTAAAALFSLRHIPIFAVVVAPIIARGLYSRLAGTRTGSLLTAARQQRPDRVKTALNWMILLVGLTTSAVRIYQKLATNDAEIARRYPVAAVDFLEREGLATARGYNAYRWGGYLIWRGVPVFVDGRADVYGDFLSYYFKALQLDENWRKPLDDFAVQYVLVERSEPLAILLAATTGWREAYADALARVFVRTEGAS